MSDSKCPSCQQSNINIVEGQRAVCKLCSKAKRSVFQFCWGCQREWPRDALTTGSCMLPNCALRAALLSDKKIDDPYTSVRGCPYFRACPGCKALLTHSTKGCPNIICPHCEMRFCFRCLRQRCLGIMDFGLLLPHHLFIFQNNDLSPCRVVDNRQNLTVLGL